MTSNRRQQAPLATHPSSTGSVLFRRGSATNKHLSDHGEPLAILLRVRDNAKVPDDVLRKAQRDVTRIYREAGVAVLWRTAESLSAESNEVRHAALTIAILTLNQAEEIDSGAADGRMGFAARAADGDGQSDNQ